MNKTTLFLVVSLVVFALAITGCANKRGGGETGSVQTEIPSNSKFAKIAVGMSMKQVADLIGYPTDKRMYSTGKMFIPFYFGTDLVRTDTLYKGEGRLTFTGGAGIAGRGGAFKLYEISYDPTEDGYN